MNRTSNTVFTVLLTALVVGGGVYLWQNNAEVETPTLIDEEVVPVAEENGNQLFQDSWLTFEYPEDIEILADGQGEGRATRWLTFMYWDEGTQAYSPVGLKLMYPTSFEEDDFYSSVENFKKDYDEGVAEIEEQMPDIRSDWYYQELTIDGRDAFLTSETGMGDPIITLYVTFDENSGEYTTKDVYQLQTAGMTGYSRETAKTILDMFIATAKFAK